MAQVEKIDISHGQLHRKPDKGDTDKPAFSFKTCDILAVIAQHESLQVLDDQRAIKCKLEDDGDEYSAIRAWKLSKQKYPSLNVYFNPMVQVLARV